MECYCSLMAIGRIRAPKMYKCFPLSTTPLVLQFIFLPQLSDSNLAKKHQNKIDIEDLYYKMVSYRHKLRCCRCNRYTFITGCPNIACPSYPHRRCHNCTTEIVAYGYGAEPRRWMRADPNLTQLNDRSNEVGLYARKH